MFMKRFIFTIMSLTCAIMAFPEFYVIMKDGSENQTEGKNDTESPEAADIKGFNDMAERLSKIEKEIESFKEIYNDEVTFPVSGEVDGYEYVDLGLPSGLLWATKNIGAESCSEYGDYYAWGETTTAPSNNYSEENCKTYNVSLSQLKESNILDMQSHLTADYDAASQNWSENWRMPTSQEYQELVRYCNWLWTVVDGKVGYKVMSYQSGNDNWIFLPATGYVNDRGEVYKDTQGRYWTSVADGSKDIYSYYLSVSSDENRVYYNGTRYLGCSVRPVTNK